MSWPLHVDIRHLFKNKMLPPNPPFPYSAMHWPHYICPCWVVPYLIWNRLPYRLKQMVVLFQLLSEPIFTWWWHMDGKFSLLDRAPFFTFCACWWVDVNKGRRLALYTNGQICLPYQTLYFYKWWSYNNKEMCCHIQCIFQTIPHFGI